MLTYEERLNSDLGWAVQKGSMHILVTPEGLREIHRRLEGLGYVPPFSGSKHLRDAESGVRIKFLMTGGYPGMVRRSRSHFPTHCRRARSLMEFASYVCLS